MAGRSEQIEALLSDVENLVASFYAQSAYEAVVEAEGKSAEARTKLAAEIAKAGRAVKLFRGSGPRAVKAVAGLRRRDVDADDQETAMNDDADWTPERIAELHAKVRERMAKFVGSGEFKRLAERDLAESDRAVPGGAAPARGASAPTG